MVWNWELTWELDPINRQASDSNRAKGGQFVVKPHQPQSDGNLQDGAPIPSYTHLQPWFSSQGLPGLQLPYN